MQAFPAMTPSLLSPPHDTTLPITTHVSPLHGTNDATFQPSFFKNKRRDPKPTLPERLLPSTILNTHPIDVIPRLLDDHGYPLLNTQGQPIHGYPYPSPDSDPDSDNGIPGKDANTRLLFQEAVSHATNPTEAVHRIINSGNYRNEPAFFTTQSNHPGE